jgi:demethylmenaquinone methyltransferase/2-methoxy-6-polyprenyl-1,4-benzoquinol methylase
MSTKISLEESFQASGGKQPYVRRLFGRIARVYDLMNRLMSLGLDQRWRAFAARQLALGTGELGLDLGAGTADLSIAVIQRSGPGTRMIGMDITPEMLEEGRRKLARLGLQGQIELRMGDAEHIELPANSVDGCCSAFTVRNLTDIRQGGRCCVWSNQAVAWSAWRSVTRRVKSLARFSTSIFTGLRPSSAPLSEKPLKNTTTCRIR